MYTLRSELENECQYGFHHQLNNIKPIMYTPNFRGFYFGEDGEKDEMPLIVDLLYFSLLFQSYSSKSLQ